MPDDDVLERVATRAAKLERGENHRAASRMARSMGLGIVAALPLIIGVSLLHRAGTFDWHELMPLGWFALALLPVIGLARWGVLPLSPGWYVGERHKRRELNRSLLGGRAVADPQLTGVAVASTAFARRFRWLPVYWLVLGGAALVQLALHAERDILLWIVGPVAVLAVAALLEFSIRRGRRADAANIAALRLGRDPSETQ